MINVGTALNTKVCYLRAKADSFTSRKQIMDIFLKDCHLRYMET